MLTALTLTLVVACAAPAVTPAAPPTASPPTATPIAPASLSTPTPTPTRGLGGLPVTPSTTAQYEFHINLDGGDDRAVAMFKRILAYLRGTITVNADGSIKGEGRILYQDISPCEIAPPKTFTCRLVGLKEGRFFISGSVVRYAANQPNVPERIRLTFRPDAGNVPAEIIEYDLPKIGPMTGPEAHLHIML